MATQLGIATEKRYVKQNQIGQAFMLVASSTVMEYSFFKKSEQAQTCQYKDVNS